MDLEKSPATPDSAHRTPHKPRPQTSRRRRCLCAALCCLSVLVALVLCIVVLAFTVFRRRDPTITISSVAVQGISPSISVPGFSPSSIQLNLTLLIGARVYNPNRVSFSHDPGTVRIFYRGAAIGVADVWEGKIPARGTEDVKSNVTLTLQSFMQGNLTAELIMDVAGGAVGMDTKTRVPGKITVLGFIKRRLVAVSDCHFVVAIPSLRVDRQECSHG